MVSIAEMSKYESYKDSGEGWIGNVPSHWDVKKLKHLFFEKKHTKNMSLNCGSISFGEVVTKNDEKVLESTKASYQEVLSGEFLINPLNLNYDLISLRIALSQINVVVSAGYLVIKEKSVLDKGYFKYLLHRYDVAYIKLLGSGVRQTISFNHIANSMLLYPPIQEQSIIAKYLGQKTAQIDEAISIKEQQIALLKERKQITIQKAVTQGLNPNVPMKDSGVDWIGQIPEHWEVRKLKYCLTLTKDKVESKYSDFQYLGMESVQAGTGLLSGVDSEADGLANIFKKGQILFGKLRPYLAKVYLAEFGGVCSTEFLVFDINSSFNREFISKLLLSDGFIKTVDASTYGSKMPRANPDFILNMLLPVPPSNEQANISKYISIILDFSESAEKNLIQQIKKLKEYKTSLINSAVTGKIKITPEMTEA
ncbi:restriction endonuclease subunit S [Xenorhabdus thuongxuanensis]|uniref:Type I restriction-modification n=2 Tax=Xenorhabdus TaxID=626 RepID=A0A1Q5U6J3_9GAMM|nr:restriction endonuclease subunit S [Xenorhabdus thuongxuanensis]OKP08089.1 type I restriction-modification [Xenorhabdus thuongxuanensis]